MTSFADLDWASAYGLDVVAVAPLVGGMLHRNFRVDAKQGVFAAKLYTGGPEAEPLRLRQVYTVQEWLRSRGLPAAALSRTRDGDVLTPTTDGPVVVTEYVSGSQPAGHEMPAACATAMGETLGSLLRCMEDLPSAVDSLPVREPLVTGADIPATLERLQGLLAMAQARASASPVDEAAALILRNKLAKLEAWSLPLPVPPTQWIHGDFQSTNVIFGADERVAGVIDFDNIRPASRAHEVTRAMEYSFPDGSERRYDLFAGFARTSGVSEEEAATYPALRHFYSLMSLWPMATRYETPEVYQQRWNVFIDRPRTWWGDNLGPMAERLVSIVCAQKAGTGM